MLYNLTMLGILTHGSHYNAIAESLVFLANAHRVVATCTYVGRGGNSCALPHRAPLFWLRACFPRFAFREFLDLRL
jgi:hypothetical protein